MTNVYIAPFVGKGTKDDPFRPSSVDLLDPTWSMIDLRPDASILSGKCILTLVSPSTDPSLTLIGQDKQETSGQATKDSINSLLNVATITQKLNDIISEILLTSGKGWNPLRANHLGFYEYYLESQLWWQQKAIKGGATASDAFTRANETPIGGNWTFDVASNIRLISNAIDNGGSSSDNIIHWNANSFGNDQYSEGRYVTLDASDNNAVCVRQTNGAKTNYHCDAGANKRIAKFVTGTLSSLKVVTYTPTANDLIRCSITGNTLTYIVNGSVLSDGTTTDVSSPLTSGFCGFFLSTTGATWDDWSGGDVTTASGNLPLTKFARQAVNRAATY